MEEKQPTLLELNGVELDCDFLDADLLDRFNEANDVFIEKLTADATYEGQGPADKMRTQCRLVEELFDSVFGEGISDKIFDSSKNNLGVHAKAFAMVVDRARESANLMSDMLAQSQEGPIPINREQRRAAQKGTKTNRTDNYRSRVANTEHGLDPASESNADDALDAALAEKGITREQFDAIMKMTKGTDGE